MPLALRLSEASAKQSSRGCKSPESRSKIVIANQSLSWSDLRGASVQLCDHMINRLKRLVTVLGFYLDSMAANL